MQTIGRYWTDQIREIQLQLYIKFSSNIIMLNGIVLVKINHSCDSDGRTEVVI